MKSDYIITNRRKQEDARNNMYDRTQYYQRMQLKSDFEVKTHNTIQRKQILRTFRGLQQQEEERLESRRQALAELLQKDEERYREELLQSESTQEDRIEAMRKRVAELRAQREAERQAIVDKKLAEQWRKKSDELRALESKKLEKQVAKERAFQLVEREQQKILEKKENEHFAVLWEQDRQKKIQREESDRLHKEQINKTTLEALSQQLLALEKQAEKEKELEREEARLLKEMQERQQLEDERKRERKMQEQRIIRAELDVFNKARIAQRQKEIQESLDRDMKILNEFVKSEQEEKESKMRRRDNLRKEMQAYREHLVQAKEIEKQRQAEIETWYANEQERLWKVRTEKWRAEQIARDKLMQEVMRTRQEQLKEALERNRHALEQVRMEKAQIEAQVAQAQKEEHEKRVKVLHNKQSYSTTLRQQIESLDERRKEEKRQQEREHQAAMVF